MAWKSRVQGGLMGLIGFLLSPLSWWNDLFVNIPLATAIAWIVSRPYRPAFEPALIAAYWLTNIIGLVLMQKGAQRVLSRTGQGRSYSRRDLWRDLAVSLGYTGLIVVLAKLGLFEPLLGNSQAP